MSTNTNETTISLDKFKAWLEGVEEMQSDDWVPSEVQWKKIRQKIDMIENDIHHPVEPAGYGYMPKPVPTQPPQGPQRRSVMDEHESNTMMITTPPINTGTFDPDAPAVVTPNIDTSKQTYVSQFS